MRHPWRTQSWKTLFGARPTSLEGHLGRAIRTPIQDLSGAPDHRLPVEIIANVTSVRFSIARHSHGDTGVLPPTAYWSDPRHLVKTAVRQ